MKPETIGIIASCFVGGVILYRLLWLNVRVTDNPWPEEVEREVHEMDASPLCLKCLTAHSRKEWFCHECGAPVGDYNNWMPYLCVFSQGEVLRDGTSRAIRKTPAVVMGFVLYSIYSYTVFAPIYWWRLYQNLKHQSAEENFSPDPSCDQPDKHRDP